MPLLEAVEHAALRGGVPVDARIESGRTPIHALQRLWERRALRPDRRPGAGRAQPGLHAEGPDLDAHARAERDADPAARPGRATASRLHSSAGNSRLRRGPATFPGQLCLHGIVPHRPVLPVSVEATRAEEAIHGRCARPSPSEDRSS